MLLRRSVFAMAVCSACSFSYLASAQEKPAEPAAEAKAEQPDYAELVRQLDGDKFQDRQAAGLKLSEAGKAAMPALIEAAQGGSREAATRAVEILKNHFQKGDEGTKAAAKEALGKIAQGENPAAARRAEEALKPKPENPPAAFPGRLQIAPGQIQIQVQGFGGGIGGNRRVTVKNVNGVKDIDVDDNGRKVKIHDDPNEGIKVEVTEKNKEGKEETKKYEAKNADELKKNHPEGHKIYEEFSKQPGGLQIQGIQIQGGAFPPGALPPGFPQLPPPPGLPGGLRPLRIRPAQAEKTRERIEAAQKRLDEALENLKKLDPDGTRAESLKKLAESIEAAKKQLEEIPGKAEE